MGLAFKYCIFCLLPILLMACGGRQDSPLEPQIVLVEDFEFTDPALKLCVAHHRLIHPEVEWTHQLTQLECGSEYEVQSLTDITAFPNLERLIIQKLRTPEVDVAVLRNLKYLGLDGNFQIVKVSDHSLLEDLYINSVRPQAVVDVANLPALKNLYVHFGAEPGTVSVKGVPRIELLSLSHIENLALDPHELGSLREFQANTVGTDNLDLSLLAKIENLDLHNWTSPEFNLTENIRLKKFRCTYCAIGAIMLAENNQLESMMLSGTGITQLKIPSAKKLTELTVQDNVSLVSLELPLELPKLKAVQLDGNQLRELPTALWPELERLNVQNNQLTTLSLGSMSKLLELNAAGNELVAVDLSQAQHLHSLNIAGNKINAIDLSSSKELQSLDLSANKLTAIDLSENFSLVRLALTDNALIRVDVEKLAALKSFDVSGNQLTQLDVTTLRDLRDLNAARNQLEMIDILPLAKLEKLNVSENLLASLMASHDAPLSSLDVSNNLFQTLDLSSFPFQFSFELKAQNNQLREFKFPELNGGVLFFNLVDLSHNQLQSLQIDLGIFIEEAIFKANPLVSLEVDPTIGGTSVFSMDISQTPLDCESVRQLPTVGDIQCGDGPDATAQ